MNESCIHVLGTLFALGLLASVMGVTECVCESGLRPVFIIFQLFYIFPVFGPLRGVFVLQRVATK